MQWGSLEAILRNAGKGFAVGYGGSITLSLVEVRLRRDGESTNAHCRRRGRLKLSALRLRSSQGASFQIQSRSGAIRCCSAPHRSVAASPKASAAAPASGSPLSDPLESEGFKRESEGAHERAGLAGEGAHSGESADSLTRAQCEEDSRQRWAQIHTPPPNVLCIRSISVGPDCLRNHQIGLYLGTLLATYNTVMHTTRGATGAGSLSSAAPPSAELAARRGGTRQPPPPSRYSFR